MTYTFNNEAETCDFAEKLAQTLKSGDVVALSGELGAGKSVFSRALMRALGVKDEALPSPTYAIIQEYDGECASQPCKVAHMDWYRLSDSEEVEMLGVHEFFAAPWISIIEWPERARHLLPAHAIRILLKVDEDHQDVRHLDMPAELE